MIKILCLYICFNIAYSIDLSKFYKIGDKFKFLDPNIDLIIKDKLIYEVKGYNISIIPYTEIKNEVLEYAYEENKEYVKKKDQLMMIEKVPRIFNRRDLNVKNKVDWHLRPRIVIRRTFGSSPISRDGFTYHNDFSKYEYSIISSVNGEHFNKIHCYKLFGKICFYLGEIAKLDNIESDIYFYKGGYNLYNSNNLNEIVNYFYYDYIYSEILLKIRDKHLNDEVVLIDDDRIETVLNPIEFYKNSTIYSEMNYYNVKDYFTDKIYNLTFSISEIENRDCNKLFISNEMFICDVHDDTDYKKLKFNIFNNINFNCLNKGNYQHCIPMSKFFDKSYSVYIFYEGNIYYNTYVFVNKNYTKDQINKIRVYKDCDLILESDNKILCLIKAKFIDNNIYLATLHNNIKDIEFDTSIKTVDEYNKNMTPPDCMKLKECNYSLYVETKIRILLYRTSLYPYETSLLSGELLDMSNILKTECINPDLVDRIVYSVKTQTLFVKDIFLNSIIDDIKNLGPMDCNEQKSLYFKNSHYNKLKSFRIIKRSINNVKLHCLNLKEINEIISSEVKLNIKDNYVKKIYEMKLTKYNDIKETDCEKFIHIVKPLFNLKRCTSVLIKYQEKFYYPKDDNYKNCINL